MGLPGSSAHGVSLVARVKTMAPTTKKKEILQDPFIHGLTLVPRVRTMAPTTKKKEILQGSIHGSRHGQQGIGKGGSLFEDGG